MAIPISIGKARIFPFTATMSNGAVDTALPASVDANDPARLKVAMNPANNRQFGVLALAGGSASLVNVTVNSTLSASVAISVPTPTLQSVSIGTDGGEIDPPAWLL